MVGVSHGTLDRWRNLLKAGLPVEMEEATKGAAIRFLEGAPAKDSPTYAEGLTFAIEKVQTALDELRAMLPRSPEDAGRKAAERARRVRTGPRRKRA